MPRFHVRDTFEIPDRKLFVMAGEIVEGEIRAGMFVRVPFNSALEMTARIHSIEFARRLGGSEDVCLCIESEPDALDLWRGLKIGDETFEITTDGSD
jgi:hypothetical protein